MLRKILIVLALLAVGAGAGYAGLLPDYGIKAGVNLSNINMDDLESSTRTGFVGGVFADLAWPIMHIQAEVLYTNKGFKEGSLHSTDRLDYRNRVIQIPVVAKMSLPIPMVSPSIYAGPSVSIPVKTEIKDRSGEWVDIKDNTKSTIWSLVLGVDVKLMNSLILDLRYDIGLTSVNDRAVGDILQDIGDEFSTYEDYDDIKDRTFTAMVGWSF